MQTEEGGRTRNAEILRAVVVAKQLNMSSLCDVAANKAKQLWCVHKNRISNRHVMSVFPCRDIARQRLGLVSPLQEKIMSNYEIERGATKMLLAQKSLLYNERLRCLRSLLIFRPRAAKLIFDTTTNQRIPGCGLFLVQ